MVNAIFEINISLIYDEVYIRNRSFKVSYRYTIIRND